MIDAETTRLANILRLSYQSRRASKTGKKYASRKGQSLDDCWIRCALLCAELDADPEDFMEAAFIHCTLPAGPYPNSLGGPAHRRWYAAYLENRTVVQTSPNPGEEEAVTLAGSESEFMAHYRNFFDLMWAYYRATEVTEEIMANMIIRGQGDVHPVIRTLLAHNNPEVQRTVGEIARWMMAQDPGIERACRKLKLPIELVTEWKEAPGDT